jgi:positive regulator of sigma E activity
VRVSVSARSVLGASARIYLLPVVGLLAGAGLSQLAATALISPAAGGNAAGIGGIAGAVAAVLIGRRLANRPGAAGPELPRVVDVLPGSAADDPPCDDATGRPGDARRVDSPDKPRVE